MRIWTWTWVLCTLLAVASIGVETAHSQPRSHTAADKRQLKANIAALGAHIDSLIEAASDELDDARIGIYVKDPTTGRVLYQRDAKQTFSVASVTKVVTMAAALAELGPQYRYRTALFANEITADGVIPGDLYLESRGDPTLTTADLDALVRSLRRLGVTEIEGELMIDDSVFDSAISPPHFDEQPDEQAAFRAPVGAANLNRNAYTVIVRAAPEVDRPARVWLEPESHYLRLGQDSVVTQKRGRPRVSTDSRSRDDRIEVDVSGNVRRGSELLYIRRRVADPLPYIGETLRARLTAHGLKLSKPARQGRLSAGVKAVAQVVSEPLNLLIHALGKRSDNFVAEILLKTLAAERSKRAQRAQAAGAKLEAATWAEGIAVVKRFLRERVGLRRGSFRYGNGSGLFDASEFTPAQIGTLLAWALFDPYVGPDLIPALAIAGTDGTLAKRLVDTPAQGRIRAKTGTLARVSALAGYAYAPARPPLVFAIFVNDHPDRWRARHTARGLQDGIAQALIAFLDDALPPSP